MFCLNKLICKIIVKKIINFSFFTIYYLKHFIYRDIQKYAKIKTVHANIIIRSSE